MTPRQVRLFALLSAPVVTTRFGFAFRFSLFAFDFAVCRLPRRARAYYYFRIQSWIYSDFLTMRNMGSKTLL